MSKLTFFDKPKAVVTGRVRHEKIGDECRLYTVHEEAWCYRDGSYDPAPPVLYGRFFLVITPVEDLGGVGLDRCRWIDEGGRCLGEGDDHFFEACKDDC